MDRFANQTPWMMALLAAIACAAPLRAEQSALQVYLPREVKIDSPGLTLGELTVMSCEDDAILAQAGRIAMGRAPFAGETLTFNRATLLARLSANGIPAGRVEFSGAPRVAVTAQHVDANMERLVQAAGEALPDSDTPNGASWKLADKPEALTLPAGVDAQLQARRLGNAPAGSARVEVTASADGETLGKRTVEFKLRYPGKQAVAVRPIAAGQLITDKNVEIRQVAADSPQPAEQPAPFGLIAARPIPRGAALGPRMLAQPSEKVLVERNQSVVMRIEGEGFVVQATGQALQDGRLGKFIKVRNVDSKRIVTARVRADGSVEPAIRR